jgi:hypothetical protein
MVRREAGSAGERDPNVCSNPKGIMKIKKQKATSRRQMRRDEEVLGPLNPDAFWKERVKIGRTTVSMRVQWITNLIHFAIADEDADRAINLSLELLKEFNRGWDSGDASFFRELAHCIECRTLTLTRRQMRLQKKLFKDQLRPDLQTDFLTGTQIINDYEKEYDNRNSKFGFRRLQDDMKRIGAVFKNSKR